MTEPFAKVVQETSVSGAEGFSVVIEGEECCPPWGNWMREGADVFASRVNTAARKYAADKIREAAAWLDRLHTSVDDLDGVATSVKCLRSRANTVEIGEA